MSASACTGQTKIDKETVAQETSASPAPTSTPTPTPVSHFEEALLVKDAAQPFGYMISVIGWSALGKQVPSFLTEVKYSHSRELWDKGLAEALKAAAFSDVPLITLAAAASADAQSGRTMLRPDQRKALQGVLDRILAEKLTFDPAAEVRPSITSAAMIAELSRRLKHRERETKKFIRDVEPELADTSIPCSPEAWSSSENYVVTERIAAGLPLECATEDLTSAWRGVVDSLEAADLRAGLTSEQLDWLRIVVLVSATSPDFAAQDRARVQALLDEANEHLSDDAFVWLYFYKLFADYPDTGYSIKQSEAANEVLTHFAARGGAPTLEVDR
ncbi:hypothetical protein [Nocardioides ochotonae]|uniref:hypothetical protein n=1 Tax=Nocardioides ochotonae TaxID=2685869 RepID=UPI0014093674|nr:hypothetical protein [Nocardioides ochotonae]